jgi:hypothetical protein
LQRRGLEAAAEMPPFFIAAQGLFESQPPRDFFRKC